MDLITSLLNLLLHIDKTMLQFIENYGVWIYVLLVAIIFAETGLVFMPFLPGDSSRVQFARWERWISICLLRC